jgi:hypothetical protein
MTLETFHGMSKPEQYNFVLKHGKLEKELIDPVYDFLFYTLADFYVEIIKQIKTGIVEVKSYKM